MENMDLRPHGLFGGGDQPTDAPLAHRHTVDRRAEEGCGCEHSGSPGASSDTPPCTVPVHPTLPNEGCGCVGCGEGSWGLNNHPLAMVYAPCQRFCALYDPATALKQGTAFSALDLPLGCTEGGFTQSTCRCGRERS